MYEAFYGLKEKPFQILSDPAYLFMSQAHENAYTHLEFGILENKGFVVITGEIGSGKTTLINYFLGKVEDDTQTAVINNTLIRPGQLIKLLCHDFEIDIQGMDETEALSAFYHFLVEQYTLGKRVILIIDEAQNLSHSSLEEIRMLSNFEMDKQHLFQVIFVGQPELKFKLRHRSLAQLAQRVTVHYHINRLGPEEVAQYIEYRLQIAGGQSEGLFSEEAVDAIGDYSRGIPRLINILCDTALVYGFADGVPQIDREIIDTVVREREVGGFLDLEMDQDEDSVSEIYSPNQELNGGQRILQLEKRVDGLERKIVALMGERGEQGRVILELLKILNGNLQNRSNIIEKLLDYRLGEVEEGKKSKNKPKKIMRFRL
jgi:general secretion pathway protein A